MASLQMTLFARRWRGSVCFSRGPAVAVGAMQCRHIASYTPMYWCTRCRRLMERRASKDGAIIIIHMPPHANEGKRL